MKKAIRDHFLLSEQKKFLEILWYSPMWKQSASFTKSPLEEGWACLRPCLLKGLPWASLSLGMQSSLPIKKLLCFNHPPPASSSQAQLVPRGLPKFIYSFRQFYTQMMGECSNPLFICCLWNYFLRCWPGFKVEDKREEIPGQLRPEFKNSTTTMIQGICLVGPTMCKASSVRCYQGGLAFKELTLYSEK